MLVEMNRSWEGPKNSLGDFVVYPAGWTGEMDDDAAGYAIATGIASPLGELPHAIAAGVTALRDIVAAYREQRVDPTFADVWRAVDQLAGSPR